MFNENVWKDGEEKTVKYLKKKGFKILKTNFSCVGVELDIVSLLPKFIQRETLKKKLKLQLKSADKLEKKMLKKSYKTIIKQTIDLLVITEVKARSSNKFGEGSEQISDSKKHNIIKGARYLQSLPEFEKFQIRFDVSSVDNGVITYIENAF